MENSSPRSADTAFFGHPAGLSTLFFTEMWERMSYYGMRALLVLYMTAALQEGGLGITVASAGAIYGLYTGAVYFMGLPGGWLADRLIGGQRAIWYGGIVIMCGHIVLAIPSHDTFFLGLILVVLGTGLLKPNIGALVGQLYRSEDERRDAGYALYYMGINVGSFIGYTVVGLLQKEAGYHWAFGAAAVGMAIGLIQYRQTLGKLGGAAANPTSRLEPAAARTAWLGVWGFLVLLAVLALLMTFGLLAVDPVLLARYVAGAITVVFLAYYAGIFFFANLDTTDRRRLAALFLVCVASILFWSGFEQAGSSLNLFARDYTDRMLGDFEIPIAWFQNANPTFIIVLSPFFAALWIQIGQRFVRPFFGIKCAIGLLIMASGFLVMFFAAQLAASGLKVAPWWLVTTYFLHTVGELCLSPVALSAVSRLSPRRFAGQMMGVFTLTYSIGNVTAGLLAGRFDPENLQDMPNLFLDIATITIGVGIVVAVLSLWTSRWESLAEQRPAADAGVPPRGSEMPPRAVVGRAD